MSVHYEYKNSMQSSWIKRSKPKYVHIGGAIPSKLAIFSSEYYRITSAKMSTFFFC